MYVILQLQLMCSTISVSSSFPQPFFLWFCLPIFVMHKSSILLIILLSQTLCILAYSNLVNEPIEFAVDRATKASYTELINGLRNQLHTSVHNPSGILVLDDPSTLAANDRYFEVKLTAHGESLTVGIDRSNIYVVAYKVGESSFFFKDYAHARTYLFQGTRQETLEFDGSYGDLGGVREQTPLGISHLQSAISAIHESTNTYDHRRGLVVIIQMLSEAVRFNFIMREVRYSIREDEYKSFDPPYTMLDLENEWSALSKGVQNAVGGVFPTAVTIRDRHGIRQEITTVREIRTALTVMLRPSSNMNDVSNYLRMVTAEMIVHIIGRDGMCVDIKGGKSDDGNPLQLRSCGEQDSQKWALRSDGTIQSLGKCMATKGFNPGNQVEIFNCKTAAKDATLWKILPDGTIASANKPVVLSAEGSGKDITLTVETNKYTTYQGWEPNTNVQPFVVSLLGYDDLCLEGTNSESTKVWVDECSSTNNNQRWVIYGDGSIRADKNRDLCVTSDGQSSGSFVILSKCNGSAAQRWVVNADGSIQNLQSKLVMDVKESNPALRQIIISPSTSKPNQQWLVFL